jgi:3D (Asp-Asp-Asp) domain-containing protein
MKITELLAEADLDGMVQDPKTGVWAKPDNRPNLERYDIDWAKFKLTISAIGAQREGLEDFSKIDAIVFLGLIGDPNIKGVYGPVKEYMGPAVFGRTNDSNLKASGFKDQGLANMRNRPGGINFKNIEEFDIILNHKYVDLASGDLESALTVAHEARHRGLHMICLIPDIMNKVPSDLRSESWAGTWVNKNMDSFMDKFHPPGKPRDTLEHMLIYAAEIGNSSVRPEGYFTTVEEVKQWRSWYMTIAAAAKSYVLNIPVPKGSALEALRKDLDDNKTPTNVSVRVAKVDQNGVTFATVPKTNTTATTTSTTISPSVGTPTSAPVPASAPSLGAPKAPSANVTWQAIYQANKGVIGGDPNLIRPGQKLTIPGHGEYIVKSGDTLSQIAANQKIKNPVREQDDRVLDQIKRSLR